MKEIKPIKPIQIRTPDLVDDINDIKDIMESQTGMKVTRPNVVRMCVKAWYELNNNG